MLILTRKLGESITIGDAIRITVLNVDGGQVQLGVDAPKEIVVHREEIYEKIQEENRRAAGGKRADLKKVMQIWRGPKHTGRAKKP